MFVPPFSVHDTTDKVWEKGYYVKVLHGCVNLKPYLLFQHKAGEVINPDLNVPRSRSLPVAGMIEDYLSIVNKKVLVEALSLESKKLA